MFMRGIEFCGFDIFFQFAYPPATTVGTLFWLHERMHLACGLCAPICCCCVVLLRYHPYSIRVSPLLYDGPALDIGGSDSPELHENQDSH